MKLKRPSLTSTMLLIGAAVFIVYIYFVNFWELVSTIITMEPDILLLTILIDLFSIVLFALGWKLLIENPGMRLKDCVIVVLVSIFGDLMIPTGSISGEILRISLTKKKTGLSTSSVTASVLLHRLILGISFGGVLGISLLLLYRAIPSNTSFIFLSFGIATLALGVTGIYGVFNSKKFDKVAYKIISKSGKLIKKFNLNYNPEKMRMKTSEWLAAFEKAASDVRKGRLLVSAMILTSRWFTIALIPFLIFYSLDYPMSYLVVLAVSIFASMVTMIPIGIPGLVGVMEISMTTFFMGFGVPANIAASATILTRLVTFWLELLISGLAASYVGVRGSLRNRTLSNGSEALQYSSNPVHGKDTGVV